MNIARHFLSEQRFNLVRGDETGSSSRVAMPKPLELAVAEVTCWAVGAVDHQQFVAGLQDACSAIETAADPDGNSMVPAAPGSSSVRASASDHCVQVPLRP